jgi:preprotein translocase subunit SecD
MSRDLHASKKAGLSGLFYYGALAAAFLLAITDIAAAMPLAIEVVDAQAGYDQRNNEPLVSFKMSEASKIAFAELTGNNVGRKLELRVDGKTISAPVIREPIFGGSGQLVDHFTVQQARDLAARLSSGAAKLEVEIVN